ncbi:hypothetical protein BGZ60DRAFT_527873 [Tricladium varicosporioides]|nr:hypothetical protein BGZ60DRAFT_527873 [Hymenoscyphus varicosporioides]
MSKGQENDAATRTKQKTLSDGTKASQILPNPPKNLAGSNQKPSKHNALERDRDIPIGKAFTETIIPLVTSPTIAQASLEEYTPFIIDVSDSSDEEDVGSGCDTKETGYTVTEFSATVMPESFIATKNETWIVNSADLTKRIIVINGEQWLETKKLFGNCFWMIERLEYKQPGRHPTPSTLPNGWRMMKSGNVAPTKMEK